MQNRIIVMGGSFNPPTIAHLRLLLAAVEAADAARGIFVPSSHTYVRIKMRRAKRPAEVIPDELRLEMLRAMAAEDPRLGVDDLEFHRTEKGYTYETMDAIQAENPDSELCFLAGGDKVEAIARWHRIREFLPRFTILMVRRDGEEPESAIEAHPFLRQYRDRFRMMEAPDGLDGISSSALRDMLRVGDPGAEALCHPAVWTLLRENGYVLPPTIPEFQGEYRFLSNFWDAPVTYEGLTYRNNEAAFQAQKCIRAEDRAAFTSLRSDEAKRLGRRVELRPDWEQVKVGIMEELVRAKFTQNEELRALLLATGSRVLEEGNNWNDTFWGLDSKTRRGQNHLGKILMDVRSELSGAEPGEARSSGAGIE